MLEVEVFIYDIHGKLIEQLQEKVPGESDQTASLKWDGTGFNGNILPAGLYSYHLIVTDFYGNKTIQQQKMIKLNQ